MNKTFPGSSDPFDSIISSEPEITWDTRLTFGKYKGKRLQWILDNDAGYLDWFLGQDLTHQPKLAKFLKDNKKEIWDNLPDDEDEPDRD